MSRPLRTPKKLQKTALATSASDARFGLSPEAEAGPEGSESGEVIVAAAGDRGAVDGNTGAPPPADRRASAPLLGAAGSVLAEALADARLVEFAERVGR